jgi:carbohydrate-selective porin OprB
MNKKTVVIFTASAFMLAGIVSRSFAADSAADQLGLKVNCGGTFVMQSTPKANNGTNNGLSAASYEFDLKVIKEFEHNGKIKLRFKGGRGLGLDKAVRTYGGINASADPTLDGEITRAKISELFYQQSFFNDKLTVDFGKLNFWEFFARNNYAEDGDSQFITAAFSADLVIDSVPQRTALRLNYALCEKLDVDYAYFTTEVDNIDKAGINILQATYKPSQNGNYRAYVWGNNSTHYAFNNREKSGSCGFGISADQAINEDFGVFVRFGYKNPSVGTYNSETLKDFKLPASLMWNAGVQMKGIKWARVNDTAGFAIGQIYGSSDAKGYISPNYKDGAETQMELYYKFTVNNYIALTPSIQYFANPKGGNIPVKAKDDVFVYGLRTMFSF